MKEIFQSPRSCAILDAMLQKIFKQIRDYLEDNDLNSDETGDPDIRLNGLGRVSQIERGIGGGHLAQQGTWQITKLFEQQCYAKRIDLLCMTTRERFSKSYPEIKWPHIYTSSSKFILEDYLTWLSSKEHKQIWITLEFSNTISVFYFFLNGKLYNTFTWSAPSFLWRLFKVSSRLVIPIALRVWKCDLPSGIMRRAWGQDLKENVGLAF